MKFRPPRKRSLPQAAIRPRHDTAAPGVTATADLLAHSSNTCPPVRSTAQGNFDRSIRRPDASRKTDAEFRQPQLPARSAAHRTRANRRYGTQEGFAPNHLTARQPIGQGQAAGAASKRALAPARSPGIHPLRNPSDKNKPQRRQARGLRRSPPRLPRSSSHKEAAQMQRTNGPIRPLCRAAHLLFPRPTRLAAAPSHNILRFRPAEHADERLPTAKRPQHRKMPTKKRRRSHAVRISVAARSRHFRPGPKKMKD